MCNVKVFGVTSFVKRIQNLYRGFRSFFGRSNSVGAYGYNEKLGGWLPLPVGESEYNPIGQQARYDAFGRLRTSEQYTIFDVKQLQGKADLYFDEATGLGTENIQYNSGDASTTLEISGSGAYAIRQTKMRFNYQPAKSQSFFTTFVLGDIEENTEARVGYFNTETGAPYTGSRDGIYLERDGSGYSLNIAKQGVVEKVYQNDWNIDKFDGKGSSKSNIDFTKSQIFVSDFEWLGVGSVRCGFVYDGAVYYAHKFNHANNIDGVYMSSPNHSIRYEVFSNGPQTSLKQICSSVHSEGGVNPMGFTFGISAGELGVDLTANENNILGAIRLKGNSLDTTINTRSISIIGSSSQSFEWFLVLNPTLSGEGNYDWQDVDNTSIQRSFVDNLGVSDLGVVLANGVSSPSFVFSPSQETNLATETLLHIGSKINGERDVLALVVWPFSNTESFYCAMNFAELYAGNI